MAMMIGCAQCGQPPPPGPPGKPGWRCFSCTERYPYWVEKQDVHWVVRWRTSPHRAAAFHESDFTDAEDRARAAAGELNELSQWRQHATTSAAHETPVANRSQGQK